MVSCYADGPVSSSRTSRRGARLILTWGGRMELNCKPSDFQGMITNHVGGSMGSGPGQPAFELDLAHILRTDDHLCRKNLAP